MVALAVLVLAFVLAAAGAATRAADTPTQRRTQVALPRASRLQPVQRAGVRLEDIGLDQTDAAFESSPLSPLTNCAYSSLL